MKKIIEKAIAGGYYERSKPMLDVNNDGCWVSFCAAGDTRVLHQSDIVLDPLFWKALGKACGWRLQDDSNPFSSVGDVDEYLDQDEWISYASCFHGKNLVEGWDAAVKYLSDLIEISV